MKGTRVAIILGLDPGSRLSGVGILRVDRDQIDHIFHGVVDAAKEVNFQQRIAKIGEGFRLLLEKYRPDVVVIEQIFLGKNADSAFKLGHARGICMYEAVRVGANIREYATRLVKKGVTGNGAADKLQVHSALEKLLQVRIQGAIDASDALALAYHHAIQMELERKMSQMSGAVR
jgi:crossover junction endodeoxyribonuclease RuvC